MVPVDFDLLPIKPFGKVTKSFAPDFLLMNGIRMFRIIIIFSGITGTLNIWIGTFVKTDVKRLISVKP